MWSECCSLRLYGIFRSLTSTGESQCHAGPAAPWALTNDSNQINVIILGVSIVHFDFREELSAQFVIFTRHLLNKEVA